MPKDILELLSDLEAYNRKMLREGLKPSIPIGRLPIALKEYEREYMKGDIEKNAVFDETRKYRYALFRIWERRLKKCVFIGLNPSTADELINDPTVTRCQNFARDWQFGGLIMLNIFAFRETDPWSMRKNRFPVGQENDQWIVKMCRDAGIVMCAWGKHGEFRKRGKEVIKLLDNEGVELHCLGLTKEGFPRHPLYLKGTLQPMKFLQEDGV